MRSCDVTIQIRPLQSYFHAMLELGHLNISFTKFFWIYSELLPLLPYVLKYLINGHLSCAALEVQR